MATILPHSISYHLPAGKALMCRGEPWLGGEVGVGGPGEDICAIFAEMRGCIDLSLTWGILVQLFLSRIMGVGAPGDKHPVVLTPLGENHCKCQKCDGAVKST